MTSQQLRPTSLSTSDHSTKVRPLESGHSQQVSNNLSPNVFYSEVESEIALKTSKSIETRDKILECCFPDPYIMK